MIRVAMVTLQNLSMVSTPERFDGSYKRCMQCTSLIIDRCKCPALAVTFQCVYREWRMPFTHWSGRSDSIN